MNTQNVNTQQYLPGLDFDFLRYMDVRPEIQREIQEFYLPFFEHRTNVVDLGCGDGDFVKLLLDHDIPAVGVDSDVKTHEITQEQGLPIVLDDVFQYVGALPPESVDGVFCAHLVEHLPYAKVIELIRDSFQALAPGGVIVLATPDVRSLFSHLEMFYLHFGHISFYHPRLLCFFLEHAGFTNAEFGTNPVTASPLMPELNRLAHAPAVESEHAPITYRSEIPPQGTSFLHRTSYALKRRLTRWLVRPLLDDLTHSVNQEMDRVRTEAAADLRTLAASLQSLNGPFECYAVAYKPPAPSGRPGEPKTAT